jgi:hypothetical protein
MKNYALLDENNIVINVSIAQDDWDSTGWIEYTNAGIGWTYDGANFIPPKPYPSWSLDNDLNWQPPTPKPEGSDWRWDEQAGDWIES